MSSEGMSRDQLRVTIGLRWCGCGDQQSAYAALAKLLDLCNPSHNGRFFDRARWVGDTGLEHLLLYMLDAWGLTEHGGSVGGCWLTDTGESVLAGLLRESADDFESLAHGPDGEGYCAHGFDNGAHCDLCP